MDVSFTVHFEEKAATLYSCQGTDIESSDTKNTAWQNNIRGLCLTGSLIHTDAEFAKLLDHLVIQGFWDPDATNGADNALKSCRQTHYPLKEDCSTAVDSPWETNPFSGHYHCGFEEFRLSFLQELSGMSNEMFYKTDITSNDLPVPEDSTSEAWNSHLYYFGDLIPMGDSREWFIHSLYHRQFDKRLFII